MLGYLFRKILGSRNEREVRKLRPIVARINELEQQLQSQPEEALRQKTADWKAKLFGITDHEELKRELEAILPEAFAVVKNACRRLCGRDIEVRGHPIRWEKMATIPSQCEASSGQISRAISATGICRIGGRSCGEMAG